jgi:hypothetical protein
MKRISVQVPDCMYEQLRDLASQHCMPMSLYARMLMVQAWKIGPEMEEVKKRVDELHSCMNGFADALLEEEPEEMTEAGQGQTAKTSKYL